MNIEVEENIQNLCSPQETKEKWSKEEEALMKLKIDNDRLKASKPQKPPAKAQSSVHWVKEYANEIHSKNKA